MGNISGVQSADKNLLYMNCVQSVKVFVSDDVYKLIGEISSSSDESEMNKDFELESYLTNTTYLTPNHQGMAEMKQIACMTDK